MRTAARAPTMTPAWPQFPAARTTSRPARCRNSGRCSTCWRPLPCLVLRGEHSDLLSAETVAEMQKRHPKLAAVTVPDRGHVPFLDEPESLDAITDWLAAVDRPPPRPYCARRRARPVRR